MPTATSTDLIEAIDRMQDAHCYPYPLEETTCPYCLSLDSWLDVVEEHAQQEYQRSVATLDV